MAERSRRLGFVLAAVCLWTACGQGSATGPDEVKWDRQTCERCQMVISERRYAAQIRRPGEHRARAFDDLGCALLWLDEQAPTEATSSEEREEVWVRDEFGTQWIDGHAAHFEGGLPTPMAYGFGVVEQGISLDAVYDRVRAAERLRRAARAKPVREEGEPDG